MATKRLSLPLLVVLVAALWLPTASASVPTAAEPAAEPPISECATGAFSTEEDFIAHTEPLPYPGNAYVSDGDMLSLAGKVCMRNADLTASWFGDPVGTDLGLDALDILDIEKRPIIAFSTEVDDPNLRFTSGDLLFTPGYAIPNVALVKPFSINWDIGLDGVQFIGTIANILNFVSSLSDYPRDKFLQDPGLLQTLLNQNKIDIWFTIEGTAAIGTHGQVLDGDLLSAATGTIVVSQAALLPANVPAGLPVRGVDFGLDGVMTPRDPAQALTALRFSTEILYTGGTSFTDGDILLLGDGIVTTNSALIQPFHPAADFLGLDALSLGTDPVDPNLPNIQRLCGVERFVGEFDGGLALIGGGGTGLYQGPTGDFNGPANDPTTHDPRGQPCGNFVPIDGFVPSGPGVEKFRVVYRLYPSTAPTPGDLATKSVLTKWKLAEKVGGGPCTTNGSDLFLPTDTNGWMNANYWSLAKTGHNPNTTNGNIVEHCANSNLLMGVWDTTHPANGGPSDPNGHYVLWLEWMNTDGSMHREQVEHHLQLDNTWPTIGPNGLQVYVNGPNNTQGNLVPPCGNETTGAYEFQIWGRFFDAYYSRFSLQVSNSYGGASFGPHKWWDPNDGTAIPLIKNTNQLGTTPTGQPVHLRNINLATALGANFVHCCYYLNLMVWDASIVHGFNNNVTVSEQPHHIAVKQITFAAGP